MSQWDQFTRWSHWVQFSCHCCIRLYYVLNYGSESLISDSSRCLLDQLERGVALVPDGTTPKIWDHFCFLRWIYSTVYCLVCSLDLNSCDVEFESRDANEFDSSPVFRTWTWTQLSQELYAWLHWSWTLIWLLINYSYFLLDTQARLSFGDWTFLNQDISHHSQYSPSNKPPYNMHMISLVITKMCFKMFFRNITMSH